MSLKLLTKVWGSVELQEILNALTENTVINKKYFEMTAN